MNRNMFCVSIGPYTSEEITPIKAPRAAGKDPAIFSPDHLSKTESKTPGVDRNV